MGNYKPQEFAEMIGVSVKNISIIHVFSCRIYGLRKYKKQTEGDEEIAKELQNRNQPY